MQAEKATDSDAAQQDVSNSNNVPAKPDVKLSQKSTLLTVAIRILCCNDPRIAVTLHIALTLPCTHCIVVHVKTCWYVHVHQGLPVGTAYASTYKLLSMTHSC